MRKFSGNKPLKVIERNVKRNGWPWDQSRFDNGSDYITFGFEHKGHRVDVVYNTFNGKFMANPHGSKDIITEQENLDGTPWYDALLDFIYEPYIVSKLKPQTPEEK